MNTPEYEIKNVADFANVPADRLDDLLDEFKDFVKLVRETQEALSVVDPERKMMALDNKDISFTWIDDGKRECDIRVRVAKMEESE